MKTKKKVSEEKRNVRYIGTGKASKRKTKSKKVIAKIPAKKKPVKQARKAKQKPKKFVHPELKKGEVWYTDISTQYTPFVVGGGLFGFANRYQISTGNAIHYNFTSIGYKSKRLGMYAYDELGNIKDNYVPVFVGKTEFLKEQKKLKELFKNFFVRSKKKGKPKVSQQQIYLNTNGF